MKIVQWVLSLIFIIQMYISMLVCAIVFLIPMILHPKGAAAGCKTYAWWVIFTARWMVGLKTEIRGKPPTYECMVAAKHQSFFDVLVIYYHLSYPKFIMKQLLLYSPLLGQYAYRLGCIPVNRGKGPAAVKKMVEDVQSGKSIPGQLVIYPQGTRVAPGHHIRYKIGTAALYEATGQACVPVATNVGLYWPKRGILRHSGTAVFEFMDPIEPGLETAPFMARLEADIEGASNALMAEAGFKG